MGVVEEEVRVVFYRRIRDPSLDSEHFTKYFDNLYIDIPTSVNKSESSGVLLEFTLLEFP